MTRWVKAYARHDLVEKAREYNLTQKNCYLPDTWRLPGECGHTLCAGLINYFNVDQKCMCIPPLELCYWIKVMEKCPRCGNTNVDFLVCHSCKKFLGNHYKPYSPRIRWMNGS